MNVRKILWVLALVLFRMTLAHAQETSSARALAEETLRVSVSSASVRQWLSMIEADRGIVISYNTAQVDVNKVVSVGRPGVYTVGSLLAKVLDGYKVRTAFVPPRKLLLQIEKIENVCVSGTVLEEESGERLYGAVVSLSDNGVKRAAAITDANGVYRLYVRPGTYVLDVSYMGYVPESRTVSVGSDRTVVTHLKPLPFEIDEVTVETVKRDGELAGLTPSSMLSFGRNDLFSQIWILPGVISSMAGSNLQVDGGGNDENLFLLDGVPVFHPGHFNSLLPIFNGDAVKNVVFHKGFFSTRLEGRLSSVTEVNIKDGNKNDFVNTLSLDMPAASVTLEGPIVKDKLSYMVGARRSWLDFFDNMRSEEDRLNHSAYDYNAKLSYSVSPVTSLTAMAYGSRDNYNLPLYDNDNGPVIRWSNNIYQLSFNTQAGKLGNTTSLFYSGHTNRARTDMLGLGSDGYISSGIRSFNASTEFTYILDNVYRARWGAKYSYDTYRIAAFGDDVRTRRELISQVSLFYDNHIRVSSRLSVQVGVHGVGYFPHGSKDYYSIQPRLSVKYFPSDNDLLYLHFSKMEQFYHCLRLYSWDLPTDFRMPSIDGYKPRSSEHYEVGWKHFMTGGLFELSAFYKTRHNVLALRPDAFVGDDSWEQYVMTGNGDSYGVRFYLNKSWQRWMLQFSYAFSRSREWFDYMPERGRMPSLYDVPHQLGAALSFKLNTHSLVSVGGMMRSGKVLEFGDDFNTQPEDQFRTVREPLVYRVDVGYSFEKSFGNKLLALRCGLYNVIGRPSDEDLLSFYSAIWHGNCLPYASISFKF